MMAKRLFFPTRSDSSSEHIIAQRALVFRLIKKLPTGQIAQLSGLSASYVSQVKHGKTRPSERLIQALIESRHYRKPPTDYLGLFLKSRVAMGCSPCTLRFYSERLAKFVSQADFYYWEATPQQIERFLATIPPGRNGLGTRHATHSALRVFYRWLHVGYGLNDPMVNLKAPIMGKTIMPALTKEQVEYLIGVVESPRDKAIIALFTESGLRLSELARIKASDIDWQSRTIRTLGKGRKEALAPFGELSEAYLRQWLRVYSPNGQGIWGLNRWGVSIMLQRLKAETGLPCNAHTFRRTFAVLLRKAGVDCLTIRDLGRWETVGMVERYTRSFNFNDAMKFYKGTLG
jgi:site-specific recombinase XerD